MRERDVIERLRTVFGEWDIGDDAAVLAPPEGQLLLASDAVVEGVHFEREYAALAQVVQKVITSNVSDIYAMGGVPHALVMTAGLPPGCGEDDVEGIIGGISLACETYGVRLVGGDTVRSPGGYFFDAAITGSVEPGRAVRRSGARPGDAIVLFGQCGGSLAGMLLLETLFVGGGGAPRDDPAGTPRENDRAAAGLRTAQWSAALRDAFIPDDAAARDAVRRIVPTLSLAMEARDIERLCDARGLAREAVPLLELARRHLAPRARPIDRSLFMARPGTTGLPCIDAMIDISDGLGRDLSTICAESGVGAQVQEAQLPVDASLGRIRPSAPAGGSEGKVSRGAPPPDLTELVLSSGEEYVLLATVRWLAGGAELPGGTVIGRIVERREGITLVAPDGGRRPLPASGFEHRF